MTMTLYIKAITYASAIIYNIDLNMNHKNYKHDFINCFLSAYKALKTVYNVLIFKRLLYALILKI